MASHCTINKDKFEIESILHEGSFGKVYDGVLKENATSWQVVAVKAYKPQYHANLLSELRILMHLHNSEPTNPNIVKLIGGSYDAKHRLNILMEFCQLGSLLDYLRFEKGQGEWFVDALNLFSLQCSHDIADGMDFLISKKVLHRDLSAKNILVCICQKIKIADFGRAVLLGDNQDVFTLTSQDSPSSARNGSVRHRAIESFAANGGQWSEKSDVWSYGVTLWELFTLGKKPYDELNDEEIENHITVEKCRLPSHWCQNLQMQQIYRVMMTCWDKEPKDRPTFKELKYYFKIL